MKGRVGKLKSAGYRNWAAVYLVGRGEGAGEGLGGGVDLELRLADVAEDLLDVDLPRRLWVAWSGKGGEEVGSWPWWLVVVRSWARDREWEATLGWAAVRRTCGAPTFCLRSDLTISMMRRV